jgi:predicted RNA-binding Zn-ribbon protein involved in translation (DUF1610 family)
VGLQELALEVQVQEFYCPFPGKVYIHRVEFPTVSAEQRPLFQFTWGR